MKISKVALALVTALATSGCGGSGGGEPVQDIFEFLGFDDQMFLEYDVDVGGFTQSGQLQALGIDPGYGEDARKVELRQNGILIDTLWYRLAEDGLYLLAQQTVSGQEVVQRTFLTPVKLVPNPIEVDGKPVTGWSTTSELEQGGSETHRIDNLGAESIDVPAGQFQAYHLVQRVTAGGTTTTLEYYFSPGNWYVSFQRPEGAEWKLSAVQ
ncbi:MAG: hypothetical protein D6806_05870 [Deltaproteobacteria bacterium]|nr:MAG: hypothetical protein D6806_05870 [Deltaproteobacteria bacterium]